MAKIYSLGRLELQPIIMAKAVQAYLNGKCSGGIWNKEKTHCSVYFAADYVVYGKEDLKIKKVSLWYNFTIVLAVM